MPRRTLPQQHRTTFTVGDDKTYDKIEKAIRSVVPPADEFPDPGSVRSRGERRETLIQDLFDALCSTKAGIKGLISGKGTKPNAWQLDIFVRGTIAALKRAELPAPMSQSPTGPLHPQVLAAAIARRIPWLPKVKAKQLFHTMQRARRIEPNVFTIN